MNLATATPGITTMSRRIALIFSTGLFALSASPAVAQSPSTEPATFTVNDTLAKAGESVWYGKGCPSCHTIGKGDISAPDLAGVLDRRTPAWLRSFLRDPDALLERDDTVKALVERYNNLQMPNFNLTDAQIEAVMHYIAGQSRHQPR